MTKEGIKIRKGITSQLVRDINATVKMQRSVYLVGPTGASRIIQARSSCGQLQVKYLSSGMWVNVFEHETIEERA